MYQFSPIDTPGAIDAFLCHWNPNAIILIESELWPNLIIGAAKKRVNTSYSMNAAELRDMLF